MNKTAPSVRALEICRRLEARHPDAGCALNYRTPFELLVATVLSAQTTDVRVNSVTPQLFAQFPTPPALAAAPLMQVEETIRPLGFFRTKAANIVTLAGQICEKFAGEVPSSLPEIVSLSGVGRKTANVVLGNAFNVPALTVDTHMIRLSNRLGLSSSDKPEKIERDLAALLPPAKWNMFNHVIIFHGRRVCHARRPACGACCLQDICPAAGTGPLDSKIAEKLVKENATAAGTIRPDSA